MTTLHRQDCSSRRKNGGRKGGDYTDIDNGIDSDPEFQVVGRIEMGRYTDTL
jgi:hypothetical protein